MLERRRVEAVVPVEAGGWERVVPRNALTAACNRELFAANGVLAVNLMGSPGSGKTALIEATARACAKRAASPRIGAICCDLDTCLDSERLRAAGIPTLTLSTGPSGGLEARMVHQALDRMAWRELDILFIDNVVNLVRPAISDLGQTVSVVALSVTEGPDKPLKYPVLFRAADVVVLTRIDLLPHLPEVELAAIERALAITVSKPVTFALSARSGDGVAGWIDWLEGLRPPRAPAPAVEALVEAHHDR